jgi:MFS transporter, DHA3 family, tetracycline resistance protein
MAPAYPLFLLLGGLSALFVGMIDPIIAVYYVTVVGLGPLQLVLLGMVVEVAGLVCEVPTGIVADLYSRRLSIIIGVFAVGVCFVVQGLLPFLVPIVLAETLRGIGGTFTSGALEAWIADEIGEAAAAPAYLRYAQSRQAGALAGTVVGVGLGSVALYLPVLIGGACMVALGIALFIVMPERHFTPLRHHEAGGILGGLRNAVTTFKHGLREIRGRPLLGTLMGLWLVYALCTEGMDRLWEAHILANFSLPALGNFQPVVWFGAINVGFMVLSIVANEVARRVVDLTDDTAVARAMVVICVMRVAGVLLFGLAAGFGLAVAGYLTTEVFRRVNQPLFTGWVNRHVDPRVRATILSMGGEVDAVGQLSGGAAIGLVGQRISLRAAMVAVGVTLAPALPLLALARRQAIALRTRPAPVVV